MAITSTGEEQDFDYGIRNLASQNDLNPDYIVTQSGNGTHGIIEPWYIQFEMRDAVNDIDRTITGENNRIIAYTAITADRTVTLPAAATPNQRIWITDESGLCSNARRIIVVPNGSDVIGGDSFAVINFPNGSGYLESNGAGKWNIISTTSIQFSAGVNTLPSITDNGDGSVTVGSGVYSLFANAGGQGRPKAYQVAGGTFALSDQLSNYIIATYNTTTGTVAVSSVTASTSINNITVIPIFKIFRDGTILHISNYDTLGLALSNKIQRSFEKTEPFRFEAGSVLIGESPTRIITISSGTIWNGGNEIPLTGVASNTHTCYQFVNTSGTWSKTVVTQYNNTQYNAAGGLVTLGNTNSYAVNYVFRSVGTDTDFAFVLGTGDYTLGQAQTAAVPSNLPTFITEHMVFVGRIIVQKSINTATQIDSANTTGALFTTAGVTDHNALNNLQGGTATERYHLTLAQYNAAITPTLQNAYNNSVQPQVLVGDSPGAVMWQSNRALNTTTLTEWKNIAGTTTASITGAGRFTSSVDASISGFVLGRGNSGLSSNTAFGLSVLSTNTVGINNTAIGSAAATLTTGNHNTAIGAQSQTANSSGNNNTAVGSGCLFSVTGNSNTAVGTNSMAGLTSTSNNVSIGNLAGNFLNNKSTALSIPSNSVFIGYRTSSLTDGSTNENVFGYDANGNGSNTVTLGNDSITHTYLKGQVGHRNAANTFTSFFTNAATASRTWTMPDATGTVALVANPTDMTINGLTFGVGGGNVTGTISNTAVGGSALIANTTGSQNVAIGHASLLVSTTSSQNSSLGWQSLSNLSSGSLNVAIGSQSGRFLNDKSTVYTTSSNSVYLGVLTSSLANGSNNEVVIGYNASGNGSNTVTLGSDTITSTYLKGKVITNDVVRLKGYTVATLPTGTIGDAAYVTDATAPAFMATVVGGGAVVTKVFYNGTNWIVG